MPRFIRNHPIWFVLLALLLAYGLWWLYQDYELRTYPQQVANSVPIPPEVKLVDTDSEYDRQCKRAYVHQYFTTNKPLNILIEYYRNQLDRNWQTKDGLVYYQDHGKFEQVELAILTIELTPEGKPTNPYFKQIIFKDTTAYLLRITYLQDIRTYGAGGACISED